MVETWRSKIAADLSLLTAAVKIGLKKLGIELVNLCWFVL